MRKDFDDYSESFTEMDALLACLAEREKNTKRISIPGKDVKFVNLDYCKRFYKTEDILANRLGVDAELIEDTKENTDIILSVGGKDPYLLGGSSWISLKNRIVIYGAGFDLLGSDIQTVNLNKRFASIDKEVQVMVIDNKVRAVMSDEYAVVPAKDLFKSVLEATEKRFDSYEMVGGYVDHTVSRVKILLPSLKDSLNTLYNLPDTYIPGIIIETSDNGFSANKIGTYWVSSKSGSFINPNEYIYMQHKGGTSLDKLLEELPNLFLKYQNTVKKFAKLMTIKIDRPIAVLKSACRNIGIPKKLTKQLAEQFELNLQNAQAEITAYDICREIFTLSTLVEETQKTLTEEKVGKAINLNYLALNEEDDE